MRSTDDARLFLEHVGRFLAADPVRHNVILTLLQHRVAYPEPGRYWPVTVDGRVKGAVFQSPLHYPALVTPMPPDVVTTAVGAIVDDGVRLPGVTGDAATAASFAGHWTERTKSAAAPTHGQRIYEVDEVVPAPRGPGKLRRADDRDRDVAIAWFDAFGAEIGEPDGDTPTLVDRRLQAGQVWFWEDVAPVAFAGLSHPVEGVVRVGPVYTPPGVRGRGYASALVGAVSAGARSRGRRCILYTDLDNPTSNSIYRKLGYRAVAEVFRYRFD